MNPVLGVINPLLPENVVHINATCKIQGKYAIADIKNWPAQLQTCGDPPGAGFCGGNKYNTSQSVLFPYEVTYTGGNYEAKYAFDLDPAWLNSQIITHRYFLCREFPERSTDLPLMLFQIMHVCLPVPVGHR